MAKQLTKREEQLVRAAMAKASADWTAAERRAVEKGEQIAEERARAKLLQELPKGEYCRLAGKQQKVIDDQARRYNLPALLGPSINLYAAIAELHQLIVHNRGHLAALGESLDADIAAEERRAKLAEVKTKTARHEMQLAKLRGELVDVKELDELLAWLVAELRTLGDTLERRHGAKCAELYGRRLDQIEGELRRKGAA